MFNRKLKQRIADLETKLDTKANVPKKRIFGSKGYDDPTDKEILTELVPPGGLEKYRNMRANDPIVGGLMLRIDNLFKNVEWEVEGQNAAIVKRQLDNLRYGVSTLISEMTTAFTYGFSLNEKIWEMSGGEVALVDLAPRYQPSIDEFINDYAIQSTALGTVDIPLSKCLHFIPIEHCRNPYGDSMLRTVYKPYYYKSSIEAAEALGIDRDLGGLPDLEAPEGFDFSKADPDSPNYDASVASTLDWAEDLVSNVRRDNIDGVVRPYGWSLNIIRGETRTSIPTVEIIGRYNTKIAVGLLQTFAVMGGFASTNNANVSELISDFHSVCDSFLTSMAYAINSQVIREICAFNGKTSVPTFKFKEVQKRDIDKLASYVARLVANGIIDPTVTLEKAMLERIKVPYTADQEKERKLSPEENGT